MLLRTSDKTQLRCHSAATTVTAKRCVRALQTQDRYNTDGVKATSRELSASASGSITRDTTPATPTPPFPSDPVIAAALPHTSRGQRRHASKHVLALLLLLPL